MPERPVVSVAMCTCEGARYLEEQLASLAIQTRLPDELVVLDDRSLDGTVDRLEQFARQSPFPVRIGVNPERLGWVRNFEKVTGLPEGDLIFYADQDDVWHPRKIETMIDRMRSAPTAGFALHDGDLVNDHLDPIGIGIWEAVRLGDADRRRIAVDGGIDYFVKQPRHIVIPGMTLAFHSSFRDLILPFPVGWWHDSVIPTVLTSIGAGPVLVPERLVRYRQHAAQYSGLRALRIIERSDRMSLRERDHENLVIRCRSLLERLREHAASFPPDPRAVEILTGRMEHAQARAASRDRRRRLGVILREVATGNYHKYSRGWWSVAKDLFR